MAKKKVADSSAESSVKWPIHIRIDTLPVAQPRQRFTSFGGYARAYTPTSVGKGKNRKPHPIVEFKRAVAEACKKCLPETPLCGPVGVDILFVFPRPKNKIWKNKEMRPYWHCKKSDIDNIIKSLLDVMNGFFWRDDSQISVCNASKIVAGASNIPYVQIKIYPLSEEASWHAEALDT